MLLIKITLAQLDRVRCWCSARRIRRLRSSSVSQIWMGLVAFFGPEFAFVMIYFPFDLNENS